jgi:integrase
MEFDERKYLTHIEDESFKRVIRRAPFRDRLMLELLRTYGMRASELLALRTRDFNESTQMLYVTGLKSSRGRQMPLNDDFASRLKVACKGLGPDDLIFPISYNRLGEIWRFYRTCDKPLHSLRHTLAIEVYQKSKDIRLVQRILGHKSIMSTMIYQEFVYGQDAMREVLF